MWNKLQFTKFTSAIVVAAVVLTVGRLHESCLAPQYRGGVYAEWISGGSRVTTSRAANQGKATGPPRESHEPGFHYFFQRSFCVDPSSLQISATPCVYFTRTNKESPQISAQLPQHNCTETCKTPCSRNSLGPPQKCTWFSTGIHSVQTPP